MIRRSAVASLALIFSVGLSSAANSETLAEALAAAYNNSGLLDQNRALLRAADEDLAQAVALTLPVITWTVEADSTEPDTSTELIEASATISASLTIYDGGANSLGIEAQKETILGTRQTLLGIEQNVLLRAVTAYMGVRRDTNFVSLRENNVRVITQEYRAAQDRFEVGEVTRTDVALAEARLAAARSLLSAAEGTLARSIEEYRVAIGRFPSETIPVTPAPVSRSLEEAKEFAVQNHPDIRETQHAVSAAEINIRRAEAALSTSVDLESFVTVDQDYVVTRQIGLVAGGTIYNGGTFASQIRQFTANRDATRAGLHVTLQSVEQEVGNAYSLYLAARASRTASDQQIRASRVAFEGIREEATLGSRTTLDVLNAEQELLDAQANLFSSQADEVTASYSVLAAMGLLTADHLKLAVQQYDPTEYYNLAKDAPIPSSQQGQALDRILRAIGN